MLENDDNDMDRYYDGY